MDSVVIKPIITEKTIALAENHKYTFQVNQFADKETIKNALEKQFNVKVILVATQIVKGKSGRFGMKRKEKKFSPLKRAIVTLKKGDKINLFDVMGTEEKE